MDNASNNDTMMAGLEVVFRQLPKPEPARAEPVLADSISELS